MTNHSLPRVLILADNASAKFGGEAVLPLHYFRLLLARGVEAWLLVNGRNRAELESALSPAESARVSYVPDTRLHRLLERVGRPLPNALKHVSTRFVGRLVSGRYARRLARQLIAAHRVTVVHQPTPVSPKEVSQAYGLGVPVVIGPMNGGMTDPPGFGHTQGRATALLFRGGRLASHLLNRLIPGKVRADVLLVANDRTRRALPRGCRGRVETLVENGVRLDQWHPVARRPAAPGDPVRFVFSGRLVDWKGVQYLLPAFARVVQHVPATLSVCGNGRYRTTLEALASSLGIADRVTFHGWLPQADCAAVVAAADVFVLPSLFECGGAVVLEAMAAGLPVIAVNWGGPADYLDPSCGVLVDPVSPTLLVDRLAEAMRDLAADPDRRHALGSAGRGRVSERFDWERKIGRILGVYADAAAGPSGR